MRTRRVRDRPVAVQFGQDLRPEWAWSWPVESPIDLIGSAHVEVITSGPAGELLRSLSLQTKRNSAVSGGCVAGTLELVSCGSCPTKLTPSSSFFVLSAAWPFGKISTKCQSLTLG